VLRPRLLAAGARDLRRGGLLAGIEHEIVTYEGAPHSFFDRKQEQYQGASDDAWKRTLDFIERHA
jgi:dienelactone hydrolase